MTCCTDPGPGRRQLIARGRISVQLSTRTPKGPPTLEQQRFDFLIRQIGDARKAFSDLEKRIEAFRQLRVQKLQPVRASLTRALRETILAIDRLLDQRGSTRQEQLLRVLADKAATRRWSKQQRHFARLDDEEVKD